MADQRSVAADVLYVIGDSWVHGSELIDPESEITNHFDPVHEAYRQANYFPKLLADELGLELVSGSYPGCGNDYIVRTAVRELSSLRRAGRRPFVIVAWTQLQRFELPIGPDGEIYRPYVSPRASDNPEVAITIWGQHSSDRSDLVRWLHQIITLDAFLKVNGIGYFSTSVFASPYRILEFFTKNKEFEPYLHQLATSVELPRHMLNFSLESILLQYDNIDYGHGGHPLAEGHRLLAKYIKAQLDLRFKINSIKAPVNP